MMSSGMTQDMGDLDVVSEGEGEGLTDLEAEEGALAYDNAQVHARPCTHRTKYRTAPLCVSQCSVAFLTCVQGLASSVDSAAAEMDIADEVDAGIAKEKCKKRSDCTKPCPIGQKHRGQCVVDGHQVCAAKTVEMDTSPNDDAPKPGAGRVLRVKKHPTEVFLDNADRVLHEKKEGVTDVPATTEKKKRKKDADAEKKLAAAEKKLADAEKKFTAAEKRLKVVKAAQATLDEAKDAAAAEKKRLKVVKAQAALDEATAA